MARARQMGMTVLKPYGDSSTYDVGIEVGGRLLRVQTKSTTFRGGRTYTCNLTGPGGRAYRPGTVDYFAVYLIPVDTWYILPFAKTRKTSVSLQFTPGKEGHKYEGYREAWHLLRGAE
jgi:PD-(D/E)XK endonuclease